MLRGSIVDRMSSPVEEEIVPSLVFTEVCETRLGGMAGMHGYGIVDSPRVCNSPEKQAFLDASKVGAVWSPTPRDFRRGPPSPPRFVSPSKKAKETEEKLRMLDSLSESLLPRRKSRR
jgi:hypothetical protein